MQRTKQNHAWRVFRLLLIFFCIGLSLQFTSCGKKQAENTVFSVDDLSGKKIVRNIGREGEDAHILTLSELKDTEVDMFTTVFVGNSQTKNINGKMVTPRGYKNV